MVTKSPGPGWETMQVDPSSNSDVDDDLEDELSSLTLKRRKVKNPSSNSKRPKYDGVVGNSSKASEKALPGSNHKAALASNRQYPSEPGPSTRPGRHFRGTAVTSLARRINNGRLGGSTTPPSPRSPSLSGSGKGKERQTNGIKPRISVVRYSSPEVIELTDDSDAEPARPTAPVRIQRHTSYHGPPSTIQVKALRPQPLKRRTVPSALVSNEIIVIDDSDDEPPPVSQLIKSLSTTQPSAQKNPIRGTPPVRPTQQPSLDFMEEKPARYVTTKTRHAHSQVAPSLLKGGESGGTSVSIGSSKSAKGSDMPATGSGSSATKMATGNVGGSMPTSFRSQIQTAEEPAAKVATTSTNIAMKLSPSTNKPPSRPPLPPSISKKGIASSPSSPLLRKQSSEMDMSGLKDVLDTTIPLAPIKPFSTGKKLPIPKSSLPSAAVPHPKVSSSSAAAPRSWIPSSPQASAESKPSVASTLSDIKGKDKQQPVIFSRSSTGSQNLAAAITSAQQSNFKRPSHSSSQADVIDLTMDSSDEETLASVLPLPVDDDMKYSKFVVDAKNVKTADSPSSPTSSLHDRAIVADNLPMKESPDPVFDSSPASSTSPVSSPAIPPPQLSSPDLKPSEVPLVAAPSHLEPTNRSPSTGSEPTPESLSVSSGVDSPSGSPTSSSEEVLPPSQISLPHRTARKSARGWPGRRTLLSPITRPTSTISAAPELLPIQAKPPLPSPSPDPPSTSASPAPAPTSENEVLPQAACYSSMAVDPSPEAPILQDSPVSSADVGNDEAMDTINTLSEPHASETIVGSITTPAATNSEDESELEYVDVPLPNAPQESEASEMMDVEELLTSSPPDSPLPASESQSPDPIDLVANDEVDTIPRRSTRSSRSTSDEPAIAFSDESSIGTSPPSSPTPPEDYSVPAPLKTFGGLPSLNWRWFRSNLDNFKPKCYYAKDLPHALQDNINRWSEAGRRHPYLVQVLQSAIQENTADDEPDAPLIEIINEVDDEPTPPWEFHYSNKMWHGENVPPTDITKLVSCGCMGKCDPKSTTCACIKRQQQYLSDVAAEATDFVYDNKGRNRAVGYPIFECNDLCGCGDECRNRVVQHGRMCAVRIQKTPEKGWGVFAGNKKIVKGSFVGIYAGELITDTVGEMRGITYNKFGRTYLFDIDFWFLKTDNPGWEVQYTVDAYHAGNFTRFLNHSCDPNCQLVPCYVNESDLEKPLLTVFAQRDIEPFEEICFSYYGDNSADDEEENNVPQFSADKDAVYEKCACKARNCTGYMFR